MNSFEWISAQDITQAAGAANATVADAMVSQSGKPTAEAAVVKAGGIDLLDLMKEGLLTPRRVINLRTVPGLDVMVSTNDGGLRIGANVTLARLAADPLIRARHRALAEAAGSSASPQIRQVATIGGNLLQRPRCWYFRSREHHCARKGGDACFAFGGENQYHAIFDHNGCAIVHPSTAATALVAFDAKLELAGGQGTKRVVSLEDFLLLPEVDIRRENDLQAGEILTAVLLPPQPATLRSTHLKQAELRLVRLVDCRCRGRARCAAERRLPERGRDTRRLRAGAASGEGGRSHAGRQDDQRRSRARSGACRVARRRAADQKRLQAADFRDAGPPRGACRCAVAHRSARA